MEPSATQRSTAGAEPTPPRGLERVFSPLAIGPVRVKNRILMTAQTTLYGENNLLGDRHVAYYRERARGGAALFICEQQGAHRLSVGSFRQGCSALDPACVPQYAKLAEAVHGEGAAAFVQLFGCGVHDQGGMIMDMWHPLWGVSRVRSPVHNETPLVMEQQHIDELVGDFGRAARHAECAGIDGVELHAAHSYLLGQFLSPAYNHREDGYGGSVAKRCRVLLEIGEEIRRRCGGDFALGVRLSFDEFQGEAGITPEQSEEQLEILAASGLFDFFNISAGSYHTLHLAVAPMSVPPGFLLPLGRRAVAAVRGRARVFIVGRILDLAAAERALADGCGDMIAMTRAQMAEPELLRKTLTGRDAEIRHCIGANECVARTFENQPSVCVLNPTVGRERQWGSHRSHAVPATARRRIVVVGGGLSGLHLARVAAQRGHRVVLLEREEELGGQLRLLARFPTRAEWGVAIADLARALRALGVELQLGVTATPERIAAAAPDAVVIATGARYDLDGASPFRPERPGIPGLGDGRALDVESAARRVLADATALGRKVTIIDETGAYLPLGVAEIAATQGEAAVEVVSPHAVVGMEVFRALEYPHLIPRLTSAAVRLSAQHHIEAVRGDEVEIAPLWGGSSRREAGVDTVVVAMGRSPDDELYGACRGRFAELHRLGDCVAPRRPAALTYEAEELGRTL